MNNCGERISALREQRKLTQEELALQLQISRAVLSHYEKNRRKPNYTTLRKIADFFQVSVDYLLGRDEDIPHESQGKLQEFADSLELSDGHILEKFTLTIDGKELTPEEAKRFIAFIRAERSMN
ncbi:helix-turn-helix domain-containing protein [Paenibacillus timonensis]|uniref:Helix-turn-helix domain-containing protein n=1 Tax=Paenibacillus timonensis TaxID=225915 RepID=A0ABW3SAT1_9BACL|nr:MULTISPECIES: helix-turn-helix transcriptional regulator [Paenibacillus]MCH1640135.1 helix-turn-helix domain-containing protein [Paenibacillus timonensis]MDU2242897.1 helix-turn-helix transcriptional regulator [Paenibacillus sp.]